MDIFRLSPKTLQLLNYLILIACTCMICIDIYYRHWTYTLLGEVIILSSCLLELQKNKLSPLILFIGAIFFILK